MKPQITNKRLEMYQNELDMRMAAIRHCLTFILFFNMQINCDMMLVPTAASLRESVTNLYGLQAHLLL